VSSAANLVDPVPSSVGISQQITMFYVLIFLISLSNTIHKRYLLFNMEYSIIILSLHPSKVARPKESS
jgi:low temperature requirement protein LtrA